MFNKPIGHRKNLFEAYSDYQLLFHCALEFVLESPIYEIGKLFMDKRQYRAFVRLMKLFIGNGLNPITCKVETELVVPSGFLLGIPTDILSVLNERITFKESYLSIETLNIKTLEAFAKAYQGFYPHIQEINHKINDWGVILEHLRIFTCFPAPHYRARVKFHIDSEFFVEYEQDTEFKEYKELEKYLEENKGKHLREIDRKYLETVEKYPEYVKLLFRHLIIDIDDLTQFKPLLSKDKTIKEIFYS